MTVRKFEGLKCLTKWLNHQNHCISCCCYGNIIHGRYVTLPGASTPPKNTLSGDDVPSTSDLLDVKSPKSDALPVLQWLQNLW